MRPALTGIPALTTARLVLRAPEAADGDAYAAFLMGARSVHAGGPLERADAWRAFAQFIGHWVLRGFGSYIMTLRATGQAVGLAGAWFPLGRPERELGWVIWSAEHEGKGLAREAALATRAHAYGVLGWETAVSYIHPDNTRSQSLARRLGCRLDRDAVRPTPGTADVWRHPDPVALAAGCPEANA